jgi:hypothetical protein
MNITKWIDHFERNRGNRTEPDWQAPITLSPTQIARLLPSLEQFQLGDGGGPASLIAHDAERFRGRTELMKRVVDLWFAEEREHSRLLGKAVERFRGKTIASHWSFSAFCFTRRVLGVNFELTVLLLTEIVSTAYYRLLRRHADDPAIKGMCNLILRDEAGHVAFHRDRLSSEAEANDAAFGGFWQVKFRLLGLGAATMLWVNHGKCLAPLGANTVEFYHEVWLELSRFIGRLNRRVQWQPPAHWIPLNRTQNQPASK